MKERIEVQLNQDEQDYIEFLAVSENSHFAAYFGLIEWENFKKAINKFDIDHPLGVIGNVDAENTGFRISISDMQMAPVTISFNDQPLSSMIDFTRSGWKKFKKDVNAFKVANLRERI